MNKILLDECVPRKFKDHLPGCDIVTVPEAGFAGKKNGELLSLAEKAGFRVLITLDQGIEYQQNLGGRSVAILVIRAKSSRLQDLIPQASQILETLDFVEDGQLVHVGQILR